VGLVGLMPCFGCPYPSKSGLIVWASLVGWLVG
jgi:hypothetical protein